MLSPGRRIVHMFSTVNSFSRFGRVRAASGSARGVAPRKPYFSAAPAAEREFREAGYPLGASPNPTWILQQPWLLWVTLARDSAVNYTHLQTGWGTSCK